MAHMTRDSWPSLNLVHWCGTLSHINIKPWKEVWICVSLTLCSPRTQLALEVVVEEASLHDNHDRRPLRTKARSQVRSDSESCDFLSFFDSWRMGRPLANFGPHCISEQRFDNKIGQMLCSFVAVLLLTADCFAVKTKGENACMQALQYKPTACTTEAHMGVSKFCEGASFWDLPTYR